MWTSNIEQITIEFQENSVDNFPAVEPTVEWTRNFLLNLEDFVPGVNLSNLTNDEKESLIGWLSQWFKGQDTAWISETIR